MKKRRLLALAGAFAFATLAAPAEGADLIAPGSACAGQQNVDLPKGAQEDGLRCLIDYARKQAGVRTLDSHRALERSAGRKAGDVIDCGFSHTACGRSADKWAQEYGYASGTSGWQFGENLAWGKREKGSARQVLKAWLASSGHRRVLLEGSFEDLGIGLRRGSFAGHPDTGVWVLQVGCRGC